jgi:cystathionine beta-lyase/cystathionine gamma-synthase
MSHFADRYNEYHGAAVPPIFQTSLFTFDSYESIDKAFSEKNNHYIYTRGYNPTVHVTEQKIAFLEAGEESKLFGSGMAAISSAILRFVKANCHVICIKNCYPVTFNSLTRFLPRFGIETTFVNGDNVAEIEDAIRPNTTLIYLESPSSLIFSLQDLDAVAKLAKSKGIATIIDNSWATPVFQQPLKYGIDVVVHSASKYLGGHSDVVAGALISKRQICGEIEEFERSMLGGIIGPFESWLILRGLRTLEIRMHRHQANAMAIADYLSKHPKVEVVHYPGLPTSPYYELAKRQMKGFSGLFSFELRTDIAGIKRFLNSLRFFKIGVSWGGFESLAYAPMISVAKEMTEDKWKEAGIRPTLVRVSIGLENAEDLLADLEFALRQIN